MAPRTIAFIDHAEELGGAEKSLMELIARLDAQRFEPVLLHTEGANWLDREELAGVRKFPAFHSSRLLGRRRDELSRSVLGAGPQLVAGLRLVARAWRLLRRLGVDIVHTNTLKAHVLGGVAARLAGKPVIWHLRDILDPGPASAWLRRVAWFVKPRIIAISEAVAEQFPAGAAQVTTIHNGVPLDRFTPAEPSEVLRDEIGLRPDDQVACIVGRLTPWKGHRTLLAALAKAAQTTPRLKLMIVGEVTMWEETYGRELTEYAEKLGIADRVLWLGFREDVPELLRLCDMFVLPSTDEPFGRVLIEAMAVGKPVVATRSGGVPEIVVDGETGILVTPGDVDELAAGLTQLAAEPDTARSMGERGMQRARTEFDVTRVAEAVQDVYADLL